MPMASHEESIHISTYGEPMENTEKWDIGVFKKMLLLKQAQNPTTEHIGLELGKTQN